MSSQDCHHSEVENFEPSCWRTLIKCPLMVFDCEEMMELGELEAHCKVMHPELVFVSDQLFLEDLKFGCVKIVLMIKDDIPYLIDFLLFEGDVRIASFCLNPCAGVRSVMDVCNVKLFSAEDLILNNNYPVINFDHKQYCPRCNFGASRNICHPGRSKRPRIDRLWTIPNDAVAELLRNMTFYCKIQLSSSKVIPSVDINNSNNSLFIDVCSCLICRNMMQLKIFMCRAGHSICRGCKDNRPLNEKNMPLCECKDVIDNTRNYALEDIIAVDFNNNSAISKILTCPICREVMRMWIPVCPSGHAICEDCEDKWWRKNDNIALCPQCKAVIGNTRNLALEKIAQKYLLKCENEGCNLVDKLANFEAHKNYCPFRTDNF